MDEGRNERLTRYFAGRRAWTVYVDRDGVRFQETTGGQP
jgi:hypothetical protein